MMEAAIYRNVFLNIRYDFVFFHHHFIELSTFQIFFLPYLKKDISNRKPNLSLPFRGWGADI